MLLSGIEDEDQRKTTVKIWQLADWWLHWLKHSWWSSGSKVEDGVVCGVNGRWGVMSTTVAALWRSAVMRNSKPKRPVIEGLEGSRRVPLFYFLLMGDWRACSLADGDDSVKWAPCLLLFPHFPLSTVMLAFQLLCQTRLSLRLTVFSVLISSLHAV